MEEMFDLLNSNFARVKITELTAFFEELAPACQGL
jgi:hypothetical protein